MRFIREGVEEEANHGDAQIADDAIEQLETWCDRAGAEIIKQKQGSDPAAVAFDAVKAAAARKAGAVIIAKTTMGEFASGIFGSASGPIHNAYDPRRHASGSSGGTGSGVAANLAAVGIGEGGVAGRIGWLS